MSTALALFSCAWCRHIAILTKDTERFCSFYQEVFGATVSWEVRDGDKLRLTFLESDRGGGSTPSRSRATPRPGARFGRGRIDHLALQAASKAARRDMLPNREYHSRAR